MNTRSSRPRLLVVLACLGLAGSGCQRSSPGGEDPDAALPVDAHGLDGGPADAALPDGATDAGAFCEPAGSLSVGFKIFLDGVDVDSWFQDPYWTRTADASVVQVVRPDAQASHTSIALLYLDDGTTVDLRFTLPDQQHVDVNEGEVVSLNVTADSPWWVNKMVSIWGLNDELRVSAYQNDWALADPPVECTPAPFFCGEVVYPPVEIGVHDPSLSEPLLVELLQGQETVVQTPGASYRVMLASAYVYTLMECYDVPLGNKTYAVARLP